MKNYPIIKNRISKKVYNIKWQKVEYKLHIQFCCLLMYLSKSKPVSKCFKIITLFLLSEKKLTKFVIIQQQPVSGDPGLAYRNLWGMQSRILFLKDLKDRTERHKLEQIYSLSQQLLSCNSFYFFLLSFNLSLKTNVIFFFKKKKRL